jgi:hypothetical protein
MPIEVIDHLPAAELNVRLKSAKEDETVLRVVQRRSSADTYTLLLFRETVFDVFVSYATEDFDLCVRDFIENLWRHGVTSVWWDRMSIDVGKSIPGKIDEGLRKSKYMISILSEQYYKKFWTREELDAVRMQQKEVIPIWVDTNSVAVTNFSPMLASKKAIVYDGDADHAMSEVARILLEDRDTQYFHDAQEREERSAFWGMTLMYVMQCLGVLARRHSRQLPDAVPGDDWRQHVENQLGISKREIKSMATQFERLSVDDRCRLIVGILKRRSDSWFPTDDEEVRILRTAGLSQW